MRLILIPSVPVNLSFFIDDLEDSWTFDKKFDFIYARMLTGSLRDWPKFIQQSFEYATLIPIPYTTYERSCC